MVWFGGFNIIWFLDPFLFLLIIKFEMSERLAESLFLFFEILFWCKGNMFLRTEGDKNK